MKKIRKKNKFPLLKMVGYIISMGILLTLFGIVIAAQTKKHIAAERSRLPVERQLNGLVNNIKRNANQKKPALLKNQLEQLKKQVNALSQKIKNQKKYRNNQIKEIASSSRINACFRARNYRKA
ncbi:MAG: hypothetical protein MZU97_10850 [Bacillus subtilis]|nr:hypothetical protein [Bacillus subtilis]